MFFLRRMKNAAVALPTGTPQPMASDDVRLSLPVRGKTDPAPSAMARVQRISATEMRLSMGEQPDEIFLEGLQINRRLDVTLPIPGPRGAAVTQAVVVGITHNYLEGMPPVMIDVEFLNLSEDEQKALRDSHPGLLVS